MRLKLLFLGSALLNVVLFRGDPDESLSARAGRESLKGAGEAARTIDRWFGAGHCRSAHEAHLARQKARS